MGLKTLSPKPHASPKKTNGSARNVEGGVKVLRMLEALELPLKSGGRVWDWSPDLWPNNLIAF